MVFAFIDTIKRGRLREFRRSRLKVSTSDYIRKNERERVKGEFKQKFVCTGTSNFIIKHLLHYV